jgi:hypothetical protein
MVDNIEEFFEFEENIDNNEEFVLDDEEFGNVYIDPVTGAPNPHRSNRKIIVEAVPYEPQKNNNIITEKNKSAVSNVENNKPINIDTKEHNNSPILALYNKAKKEKKSMSICIDIELIDKNLYSMLCDNFDCSDELINIIIESLDKQNINEQIEKSLKNHFE